MFKASTVSNAIVGERRTFNGNPAGDSVSNDSSACESEFNDIPGGDSELNDSSAGESLDLERRRLPDNR